LAIKKHLNKFYPQLAKRSDRGDTPYNLRSCAYIEDFFKPKIIYSEIVRSPQFYFDKEKYFCEATTFLMTGDSIKYICAVLNSALGAYFFKNFYAGGGLGEGGYRYKKKFLENLPIPKVSNKNKFIIDQIKILVDKIMEKRSKNSTTKKLEYKINRLVSKLYKLSNDEIEFIDSL